MYDIIVIGAGPAGSEAACRLATLGYSVTVLERDKLNREKACGGGIQRVEIDEFGEPPMEVVERTIPNALIVTKQLFQIKLPINPSPVTVMRSKYDTWLQERAMDKGVTYLENTTARNITLGDDPQVLTSSGTLRSKVVVDASGFESVTRKSLGLAWETSELSIGVQYHLELPSDKMDNIGNCCEFYFDSTMAPNGFCWLFPKKETVAVGMCGDLSSIQRGGGNLKKRLEWAIYKHPLLSKKLEGGKIRLRQSAMLPVKICERLVYGNSIIIGDAAGLINPLWGSGIYPARLSAKIAAEVVDTYLKTRNHSVLEDYTKAVRQIIWEDNNRWSFLMKPFLYNDALMEDIVTNGANDDDVIEGFQDLLMFYKQKVTYRKLRKKFIGSFQRVYPLTRSEIESNLIYIPRQSSFEEIFCGENNKTLIAVSYCVKSFDCPQERFSTECHEQCALCEMSRLKKASSENGFDFRIASDDDRFINFLEENVGKYQSLVAVVCSYTANKIGYAINKIFGLKGVVIPLRGDVCTSETKYLNGVKGLNTAQTKTNLMVFFETIKRIKACRKGIFEKMAILDAKEAGKLYSK